MRKAVLLVKRAPSLTVEAFQDQWPGFWRQSVGDQNAPVRCVVNLPLPQGYRKRDLAYDGVVELWFDSDNAMDPWYRRRGDLAALGREMVDCDRISVFPVELRVVKDGGVADAPLKNIEFVNRRRDLKFAAFHHYWWKIHGPIAAGIPQVCRYEQNQAAKSQYVSTPPPFDGLAITWFRSTAEMRAAVDTDAYRRAAKDEPNFLSGDPVQFIIARETVIR